MFNKECATITGVCVHMQLLIYYLLYTKWAYLKINIDLCFLFLFCFTQDVKLHWTFTPALIKHNTVCVLISVVFCLYSANNMCSAIIPCYTINSCMHYYTNYYYSCYCKNKLGIPMPLRIQISTNKDLFATKN